MKKRTYTLTVIASTVVAIIAVFCIIIILAAGRNNSGGRRLATMENEQDSDAASTSFNWGTVMLKNLRNEMLDSVKKTSPLLRGKD